MNSTSSAFDPSILLKYAPNPTAVVDKNLVYVSVSLSWTAHHSIPEEDAIGKSIFELFPNMSEEWKNVFFTALEGQHQFKIDTVIVKNQKLQLQWMIIPWLNNLKEVGGLLINIQDITERKRLESQLKESDERFKSAFEFSGNGMVIVSTDGKYVHGNKQMTEILGYSETEFIGLRFKDITHPDDIEKDAEKLQQLDNGEINFYNHEKRYFHKNGSIIWVLLGVSLIRDNQGKPNYYVSQLIDRTEAKKAEEEIRKSKENLQKIMDESMHIICNLSYDGEVLQINKACTKIWGYEPEELLGTPLTRIVYNEDLKKTKEMAMYIRQGNDMPYFENRYVKKDGTIVPMIWSIRGNSKDKTIFAIVQDATEKKQTEEQLNILNTELRKKAEELFVSNQYLQEFAFVASHDLQEPLRMISSFLDLLEKKYEAKLDENGKKYIHFAVDGANRMQKMILGLLEYATVGNNTESFVEVDLNKSIREALEINKLTISKKEAKINYESLPTINGNESMLLQLFHNLINNALKYQKETVNPSIHIKCTEHEKEYLFQFQDNGIGIEKKYSEKIFVLFQRLHNRRDYSGSGIGLSICKKIVENHRGKIWVESEPGEGSSFFFTLSKA